MQASAESLIAVGVLFLAGLALDALGRRVHVPRVTLLIVLGVLAGPAVLDVLPPGLTASNEVYAPAALTMVAFLLGGSLNRQTLGTRGREILVLSIVVVAITAITVAAGMILFGAPLVVALALAGIATATDPAATRDVVQASDGPARFSTALLGIVAIDDAWGLLVFSLILTAADMLAGAPGADALWLGLYEGGGAVLLGLLVGFPAARLTGRLKPGEPTLIEALGLVFVLAGAALYLEVSFLLAGMTCGAVVATFAHHHERPFHEMERVEWPFLLLFFVMAGASLDPSQLSGAGGLVAAYCVWRLAGRLLGGYLGAVAAGSSRREGGYMGISMLPQAGVAVGMALVAAEHFPQHAELVLGITIASTILFEIAGPIVTQIALRRVGDTHPLPEHAP